jgi:hypothetical protein
MIERCLHNRLLTFQDNLTIETFALCTCQSCRYYNEAGNLTRECTATVTGDPSVLDQLNILITLLLRINHYLKMVIISKCVNGFSDCLEVLTANMHSIYVINIFTLIIAVNLVST